MPNVWAAELREFLAANERAIAAGEMALATTFRHVMGRQAQVPNAAPPPAGGPTRDGRSEPAVAAAPVPQA